MLYSFDICGRGMYVYINIFLFFWFYFPPWTFYGQRKSGNEPPMNHGWSCMTSYELTMIHRWDALGSNPGDLCILDQSVKLI